MDSQDPKKSFLFSYIDSISPEERSKINVSDKKIWLEGKIAAGPDYRLYMTPKFVQTERDFLDIKDQSVQIAPIKAFENFSVDVPMGVDVSAYPALLIWCEAFGQFITAAELSDMSS